MKIVSFTLPNFLDSGLVDDPDSAVYAALQLTAHEVIGDDVVTERMAETDPRAAAFRGDPAIEHDHSHEYAFYATDSAASADGFGTIEFAIVAGWRQVAVLRTNLDWQIARYGVALELVFAEHIRVEEAA
jgi:hypothetical protein